MYICTAVTRPQADDEEINMATTVEHIYLKEGELSLDGPTFKPT